MKYKITHDMPGRIRIRCGQFAFSLEEGYKIDYALSRSGYVEEVNSCHITGSILIYYKENFRTEILKLISKLNLNDLPSISDKNRDNSKEIDITFRSKLLNMISKRLFIKLFMPMSIGKFLLFYRSIRFAKKGFKSLFNMKINVDVLDAASIGAAMIQKEYSTAGSIMFLLSVSDLLEEYTRKKTKNVLTKSLAINVDSVWLAKEQEEVLVPISHIQIGDKIRINTGHMIPVDGLVYSGLAMVNEASMTGEPLAIEKKTEDTVYAGTVVEEGSIIIEVKKLSSESRISKIIEMVDKSENLKANIQSEAEKLADNIVPFTFLGALTTYAITRNITKALAILLVDYSCAIKLSTPISVISAMREASTHKVIVKGGKYLEIIGEADTIIFDKTGTLTVASPTVAKVIPFEGFERDYVLKTAACLEEHFPHSVAKAVVKKAAEENLNHKEEHAEVQYVVAHGIASCINDEKALVGSYHFVFEDEGVALREEQKTIIDSEGNGYSIIYLAVGGQAIGFICINDPVREDAKRVIKELKNLGIEQVIMITGDGEKTAKIVAESLEIDNYYSQVLPEDKAKIIEELREEGHKVIMVGDGVNDSPALAAADVSIAMKDASDVAKEVADVTLISSDLEKIVTMRILSKKLLKKINNNYSFIMLFNTSLLLLGLGEYIKPTTSALLHNISTMGISAASMRPCLKS
ncbi:heavy metal translocating P-type ATPase [Clostridium sp. P21]|uniref:Cd(2+)-exporting ATPase n=1 Tax=Clostridium muellerianum TaxID=2716538 RepID=A0A7Y0EFA8_9CLOT|nr:heavy metal translocating P-type ATPase [Clostridium muellerianum]NMM62405.1 heavy metal translocating P-type ATPase [Clostridium muellerianum]